MPESKDRAVIWDMDGVIADTAPYHYKAWQQVFRKRGVSYTEDDFKRKFGQRNDTIIRSAMGEQISQNDMDTIAEEKEKAYRTLARGNIKPLPGAEGLLRSLGEHGFGAAIASSAPTENIRLVTRSLGINGCFQAIVSGHEVTKGKPNPQGFLLAAQKLGVEPAHCIVIEDAVAGVEAARRAGMRCIAVTNTHPAGRLKEADLIVDTLEAIRLEDLKALVES